MDNRISAIIFVRDFTDKSMKKMKPQTIKQKIRTGDYELIAKISGYKKSTVEAQIRGQRTLKQAVIEAAKKVFANRESMLKK